MNRVPNLIQILHSVLSPAARCSKGMPERTLFEILVTRGEREKKRA